MAKGIEGFRKFNGKTYLRAKSGLRTKAAARKDIAYAKSSLGYKFGRIVKEGGLWSVFLRRRH